MVCFYLLSHLFCLLSYYQNLTVIQFFQQMMIKLFTLKNFSEDIQVFVIITANGVSFAAQKRAIRP